MRFQALQRPIRTLDFVRNMFLHCSGKSTYEFRPVFILGVRGFFDEEKDGNNRAIYDDAIFVATGNNVYGFNANCDPSISKPGMAVLQRGVYRYMVGTHNITKELSRQYKALVQAGPVNILRDDMLEIQSGWFGINIHRGDYMKTASAGCQTIHPTQWDEFIHLVEMSMGTSGLTYVEYGVT